MKKIIYISLTGLGLIFVYNYIIAPLFIQSNIRMGMGMHSRIYKSTSYIVDERFLLVITIGIIGTLLYIFLRSQVRTNKCNKCGNIIESDSWKVCPICGNPLKGEKG
ncbi:MAG TPA: hypothetical protein VIO64_03565 [Pseudobacteroides sp.]|uniref:zinc ribbon domain-containing protein n=1 Tax=Pseudobacteroides sp. TaxID=1968840 RepID=UPI002F952911